LTVRRYDRVIASTLPNVSLAREVSSPAVFLVVGDRKFWIDQADAGALRVDMRKVHEINHGALGDLTEARLHAPPAVRPSDVFFDCWPPGAAPIVDGFWGRWHYNCQPSTSLVRRDVLVAGWLQRVYVNHFSTTTSMPAGVEDVFYDVEFDAAFLDAMYGPGGLSAALVGAFYPGNPPAPKGLRFGEPPSTPGAPREVTFNSWILPGQPASLHGELNAWHQHGTGVGFTRHWVGRGDHPAHWVNPLREDTDAWFPFDPRNPEGRGGPLLVGDYVVMRGALWQDTAHPNRDENWNRGDTTNHDGWLEMHPVDWVVRVRGPAPHARLTARSVSAATAPGSTEPVPVFVEVPSPEQRFAASGPTRRLEIRSAQVQIDRRITVEGTYSAVTAIRHADRVDVSTTVSPVGGQQGRFKGSWLVGWRELDHHDRPWVEDAVPAGAELFADGDTWEWVATDPEPYVGSRAHRSAVAPGAHQHYFVGATAPMSVGARDTLFAMVHLDPDAPPDELMLQWHTNAWRHRAYWGEDLLAWGAPGAPERTFMGRLPFAGEWVRLEVPAAAVALAGATVNGMAFTLSGGGATWDYAGVRGAVPKSGLLAVGVEPAVARAGRRVAVTVRARDGGDGSPVAGRVLVEGTDVAATNTAFSRRYDADQVVVFTVLCPGYAPAEAELTVLARPDDT
jgi:hypothetical protein